MGLFTSRELGIQFDSELIAVVETEIGKRPRALSLAVLGIEEGQVAKGQVQDAETLGHALKQALQTAKPQPIKTKLASICLGEELVFRKVVTVPDTVKESELAEVVKQEVLQFLPSEPELMEIDFQVIPNSRRAGVPVKAKEEKEEKESAAKEKGKAAKDDKKASKEEVLTAGTQQVAVVAVEKSIVHDWLAMAEVAKLTITSVEPRANALARALVPASQAQPVLVAEMIRDQVVVALIQSGVVWATTIMQLLSSQTESEHADVIADELIHLVKLYQNRTEAPMPVEWLYLVGSDPVKREAIGEAMSKLVDQKLAKLDPLVRCSEPITEAFYAAAGTSIFSLGGRG